MVTCTGHIDIHEGADGRTYVRTDVHDVMAIKPNFLTSMGYHIFLTMVLRALRRARNSANKDNNNNNNNNKININNLTPKDDTVQRKIIDSISLGASSKGARKEEETTATNGRTNQPRSQGLFVNGKRGPGWGRSRCSPRQTFSD